MEFCHSYLFVTFVVMTVDQIVWRDDGAMMARFDHRDRIATFFEELAHLL